ncbi:MULTISPECIES: hypothetical protein [Dysgonomonas]|uniref:hypothetical protein n=1 Tax=Dysgonomonas TaxID=156973 RepID=UPI000926DEF6|nr:MULTISPECIES: hypothetical protein [Dysgonomonas]MBN9303530.1 hypothetical protein [Dysgonomonas mossii]OJX62774.1 MAG: hypothetical protein BGO84_04565 [Dysgonomonas sp. 37-18]
MKKIIFTYLLSLFIFQVYGQSLWRADTKPVEEKGYYNIELDQHIIAKSVASDLSDLRIYNSKNKEISYFLRAVSPVQEVSRFESYSLKQNIEKDSLNIVIVDNTKLDNISRFYIFIRSADVNKYASVRGSNDLSQWYIVKQKTHVYNLEHKADNNEDALLLDIPQGNYKYYEITIENDQNSPLKILRIGNYASSNIYGQFSEINLGRFVAKDSINKKTYISFPDLQDTYKINRLEISVQSDAHYLRNVLLSDTINRKSLKFDLSSKTDNSFIVDYFPLGKHTFIAIENNNNLPLDIVSIKVYGLNRYLCAYLEKGEKYYLEVGMRYKSSPDYDIDHFKNDIPVDLPIVKTENLSQINMPVAASERQPSLIEKPLFLWAVIILIGLFLTFVCYKTIKEMKKK